MRNRIHVSVEKDYRKRDLPEVLYTILSTVREVGKCKFTHLLYHVQIHPPALYHYLKILERCGYLQVDRVGRRRVYVTITDTGKGFTDDLREYLRVRQMYTIMHRELKEKIQSLYWEGTVIE